MILYKNLSCSLSLLHENKNEVDKGISKAEKTAAYIPMILYKLINDLYTYLCKS